MTQARMAITTAVLKVGGKCSDLILRCTESWVSKQAQPDVPFPLEPTQYEYKQRNNTPDDNLGVTGSLQWLYEHTSAPIIACLHSDLEIHEQGWDQRVLKEFDDPSVGVVGFGGARQLGEDGIYKTPYRLTQLRRIGYMSNQTDAETHGGRFAGERDVATLDGFALVVRRELLARWIHTDETRSGICYTCLVAGWPVQRYPFHSYDNALCLEAAKQGWRVRLVGIACTHHGGATATTPAYQQWSQDHLGMTDAEVHTQSHLHLYEDGRGWLPLRRGE